MIKSVLLGYCLLGKPTGSKSVFTNTPDKIGIPLFYWSIFVGAILASIFMCVSGLWAFCFMGLPLITCGLFLFDGSD